MARKTARVDGGCVACGTCAKVCPRGAIAVRDGVAARVNVPACIGCASCAGECIVAPTARGGVGVSAKEA